MAAPGQAPEMKLFINQTQPGQQVGLQFLLSYISHLIDSFCILYVQ